VRILSVISPMTQLNTPYPSTAFLTGFLRSRGFDAVQVDLATYEGGWGSYSYSPGIDSAIEDGGDLIARLEETGVDPDVQLYLLAGENPLMPNGVEDVLAETFGQIWVDMATAGTDAWAALLGELVGDGLVSVGVSSSEVQGLAGGKVILGEVTGPSDGLVFVSSATKSSALTARGAVVEDSYVANLSHLDLLYASPVTAALMQAEADEDPLENGWESGFADRYAEADTIGWVEAALADPDAPGGEGEGEGEGEVGEGEGEGEGEGDILPGEDDTGGAVVKPGCACASGPGGGGGAAALLALLALRRRRR
jgi:MYXO-CTERM domain-containing protein